MFLNKSTFWHTLILVASLTITSNTHALPTDSQQPILISSDTAVRDDKLGLTIYEGNVDINQGSLQIKADKVSIYSVSEEVTKIIAVGSPASFKQQPTIGKGNVVAKAKKIEYSINKKNITLTEDASIDQDGSSIASNKITYDLTASRIEAEGQTNTSGDNGRVNVVIPAPNTIKP